MKTLLEMREELLANGLTSDAMRQAVESFSKERAEARRAPKLL